MKDKNFYGGTSLENISFIPVLAKLNFNPFTRTSEENFKKNLRAHKDDKQIKEKFEDIQKQFSLRIIRKVQKEEPVPKEEEKKE